MTIAHLTLPLHPEPHGFHAVLHRGRARIAKGRTAEHRPALDRYQAALHLAGLDWIEDHAGTWPHYETDALFLGALFWRTRPTSYRLTEMWHRTRRGGDTTTLLRAAEDALTGALYRDDGQISLHLAGKPLLDRSTPERVELWVAPIAETLTALQAMLAQLPLRQAGQADPVGPTGLLGQPRNDAAVLPVISDARSPGDRSIPGLSSPLPSILFPSAQESLRGR